MEKGLSAEDCCFLVIHRKKFDMRLTVSNLVFCMNSFSVLLYVFLFCLVFFFLKFYLVFSGVDLLSLLLILHTDYRQKMRGNFVEFL